MRRILIEHVLGFPLRNHDPDRIRDFSDVTYEPAPCIMNKPIGFTVVDTHEHEPEPEPENKPPYRVPAMAEINDIPWNGFTAASTFSGCGGSSLGYRMAGFKVAWASEFVAAARETYIANSPTTTVDDRDIRDVTPQDVLDALGIEPRQLHLLDGSPPCASFSTAGKREKSWGQVKEYSDTAQRSDDLFFEYARIVDGVQPCVFVAENVSGLVRGKAKGYFRDIMRALKRCGYKVQARVLDAQWLGVPQTRKRLIFIGVRDDLPAEPVFPAPLPYRYSVRDALPWITAQGGGGSFGAGELRGTDRASPTIGASPTSGNGTCPASMVVADATEQPIDPETGENIDISHRAIGKEWARLFPGHASDKYFNLVRSHPDRPAATVTASAGSVTLAGVTHYSQPRKFTLTELRAICGFPEDFTLTGTYAQRWERLGRAVPPVMMSHIAAAIRDRILNPLRDQGHIT